VILLLSSLAWQLTKCPGLLQGVENDRPRQGANGLADCRKDHFGQRQREGLGAGCFA